ncbi:MAG: hypothetical protein HFI91_14095 [Lachnospiraceae bacterium]|jgi:hypothetical protein|nr:hypothetical protein [Lachnospiraceae bacterium]
MESKTGKACSLLFMELKTGKACSLLSMELKAGKVYFLLSVKLAPGFYDRKRSKSVFCFLTESSDQTFHTCQGTFRNILIALAEKM